MHNHLSAPPLTKVYYVRWNVHGKPVSEILNTMPILYLMYFICLFVNSAYLVMAVSGATSGVWRSVLSYFIRTQVVEIGNKHLHLLTHCTGPMSAILMLLLIFLNYLYICVLVAKYKEVQLNTEARIVTKVCNFPDSSFLNYI